MRLLVTLTVSLLSRPLLGYPQSVHKNLTTEAFRRAASETGFLEQLGILPGVESSLAEHYAALGAFDEDGDFLGISGGRSVNHFYDPVNQAPLTVYVKTVENFCQTIGARAWSWGLEDVAVNKFALPEAKIHLFKAITGESVVSRATELKLLFGTLGHVVHLIQDMAQPEHTRNDQHWMQYIENKTDLMPSLYEAWTEVFGVPELTPELQGYFEGYATVTLPNYRDYFWTPDHKGIADFSNRNFVTQDTNYQDEQDPNKCEHYVLPYESDPSRSLRFENVKEQVYNDDGVLYLQPVWETIYTSHPIDLQAQEMLVDPYHDLASSVDLESKTYDPSKTYYSLADSSYQVRAAMLLPRAVGYSAGLIERFFRGRIAGKWTKNAAGGGWDLTIKNLSAEPIGESAYAEAYYRTPGTAGPDLQPMMKSLISTYVGGFQGLAPGASVTIPNLSNPALSATDCVNKFERRIFLRATLGNEPDAVIGLVQPPETNPAACPSSQPGGSGPFCYSGVGCGQPGELKVEATMLTPGRELLLAVYAGSNLEYFDQACTWCDPDGASYPNAIPNSTIQNPAEPGGTRSIKVQVAADTAKFAVYLMSCDYNPAPVDVAFRMFVNGQVVRQWTTTFTRDDPWAACQFMAVSAYPCLAKEPPCSQ